MKPKSALFLSAVLTAFVLVIVGSLVASLNSAKASDVPLSPTASPEALATDAQPVAATATQVGSVGPEQAASIAAEYLQSNDVYSVETFALNGTNVYKVVFSSGTIVYVGLDGSVISTETMQPTTVYVDQPTSVPSKHKHNGGGNGGGGDDDHHENEDED